MFPTVSLSLAPEAAENVARMHRNRREASDGAYLSQYHHASGTLSLGSQANTSLVTQRESRGTLARRVVRCDEV